VHGEGNHDNTLRQVVLYAIFTSADAIWGWFVMAYQVVKH
jgi:hypothetical protein